jgi:hypothetical protein
VRLAIVAGAALLGMNGALAAPKIESVTLTPRSAQFSGGKPPEVQVSVSVTRGRFDTAGCDARVDFGDGQGRTLDFGVADKRTVHHVYKKEGKYLVVARGAGAKPCAGTQQAPLTVAKSAAKKARK